MATVRWTPEQARLRLMAVAERYLGRPLAWTLVHEKREPHPEWGEPDAFDRAWQAEGARLEENGHAGAGNPRDGWGWQLHFELSLDDPGRPGERPVSVELLGGDWACVIPNDTAYVRFGGADDAARIQAWLREAG